GALVPSGTPAMRVNTSCTTAGPSGAARLNTVLVDAIGWPRTSRAYTRCAPILEAPAGVAVHDPSALIAALVGCVKAASSTDTSTRAPLGTTLGASGMST